MRTLKTHEQQFVQTYLSPIVNDGDATKWIWFSQLVSKELRFCPVCIQDGYHSYFHQLHGLTKCPFHDVELETRCPSCGMSYTYGIRHDEFRWPFLCDCGWHFLKGKGKWDLQSWSQHRQLKLRPEVSFFKAWGNPRNEVREEDYYLGLYPSLQEVDASLPNLAKFLNGICVEKSISYGFGASNGSRSNHESFDDAWPFQPKEMDLYLIFKSIARQLRKAIKGSIHIKAIRELQLCEVRIYQGRTFPFDPAAYAYVKWREGVEKLAVFSIVDRGYGGDTGYLPRAFRKNPITLSRQAEDTISDLKTNLYRIRLRREEADGNTDLQIADLAWILKHLIARELKSSYHRWLEKGKMLAQESMEKQVEAMLEVPTYVRFDEIKYKEILAIFQAPINNSKNSHRKTGIYFF